MAARSMGVKGINLGHVKDPIKELSNALLTKSPYVIEIPISETEMVFPMVAPGGSNKDMIHGEER